MISVSNLTYSIGSFSMNISLDVRQGEYLSLMGETGCGKSMFLENLCGLRQPTGGQIQLRGVDLTGTPARFRKVGYVPQDGALYPHLNVFENIAFGLKQGYLYKFAQKHMRQKHRVIVHQLAQELGISHLLNRSIAGLSGGERQRVALARAIAPGTDILLLDEPVSALDEKTRVEILEVLKRTASAKNLTVIHVNHSVEETLAVADSCAIIRDGSIICKQDVSTLLETPPDAYTAALFRHENWFDRTALNRYKIDNDQLAAVFVPQTALRVDNESFVSGKARVEVFFFNNLFAKKSDSKVETFIFKIDRIERLHHTVKVVLNSSPQLVIYLAPQQINPEQNELAVKIDYSKIRKIYE